MIDQVYIWFQSQFTNNEIFQGLIGGSLFASGLYLLRGVPERLYVLYLRIFTCELTIFSEDPSFKWICDWLAHHEYANRTKRIQVSTIHEHRFEENERERWVIAPGEGPHLLWYKKRPIILQREIRDTANHSRDLKEKITIRFFTTSQNLVRKLLHEAKELQTVSDLIEIYSWNDDYWSKTTSKFPRDITSIVLKRGQLESLIEDLRAFYASSQWYRQRGVPWHRGYLFSGVPGTGKSTLAFVLASYFRKPLYSLNLGSCSDDSSLINALQLVPSNAILLLEDIDAIQNFAGAEHRQKNGKEREVTTHTKCPS